MASNYTENFSLCQWETTDQVLREEFNGDHAKIDAALKGLADQDMALEETLASQAEAILKRGNCQIYFQNYTGDGTNNRSFSFPVEPLLVIMLGGDLDLLIFGRGQTRALGHHGSPTDVDIVWSGNTATLSANFHYNMCNHSGKSYILLAFYQA